MNKVYLTQGGKETLEKELKKLKDEKRPRLVDRLAEARSKGDLSENSDYANAREELSIVDGRIEELESILSRAKLIENKKSQGMVGLGCRVTVSLKEGETHDFIVVGEWEADPTKKKISHSSPLGKALMGKKVGQEVEIKAPAGKIVYKITEIN